jgi:hypothetical protein
MQYQEFPCCRLFLLPFGDDLIIILYTCAIMNKFIAAFTLVLACITPAAASELPMQDEVTIAAVGDLMLGGRAEPLLNEFGPD